MASSERRIARELETIRVMIGLYCRDHHGTDAELCEQCRQVSAYAEQRVDRCPFRADKPTCANCTVHCFKPAMRERIRSVMRYAGPRMALRHPVLSVFHFVDGRRRVTAPARPGANRPPAR
jgi:hypothetical protein